MWFSKSDTELALRLLDALEHPLGPSGFTKEPCCLKRRKSSDICDVISVVVTSCKETTPVATVYFGIICPPLDTLLSDLAETTGSGTSWPISLPISAVIPDGFFSPGEHGWKMSRRGTPPESRDAIVAAIENFVIPWLDHITTLQSLFDTLQSESRLAAHEVQLLALGSLLGRKEETLQRCRAGLALHAPFTDPSHEFYKTVAHALLTRSAR